MSFEGSSGTELEEDRAERSKVLRERIVSVSYLYSVFAFDPRPFKNTFVLQNVFIIIVFCPQTVFRIVVLGIWDYIENKVEVSPLLCVFPS